MPCHAASTIRTTVISDGSTSENHSKHHSSRSTTPEPDPFEQSSFPSRALHSLGLAYSMCSQEYISVECNVCGMEYSHYKPRNIGFGKCTDNSCKGLTRHTTPMQGGTCASCIMEEKRAEQDRKRGPAAAEERKGSGYSGYQARSGAGRHGTGQRICMERRERR